MKVLHCITGLTGDGAQRMLLRLATGLNARGVSSHVINLGCGTPVVNYFRQAGIPVYSLNLSPSFTSAVKGVRQVRTLVDKVSPDVVQGWMYHANVILSSARPLMARRLPVLWNIRRGLEDFAERGVATRFVIRAGAVFSRAADHIIYCSRESRTQHEEFGYYSERAEVLENGFDTQRFAPSPDRRVMFRALHQLSVDDFVIGNVARYDVAKGHTYLIEAFAVVARALPRARLVLCGRGMTSGNDALEAAIQKTGVRGRVLLLGETEPIEHAYPGFDLYCSSSLNEGFPNALSEAMACGVPCVTTDTGASRQLVEGQGLVVKSRDPHALAEAIIEMCQRSPAERLRVGMGLRQRIEAQFGLERMVGLYHSLYQDVCA